MKRFSSFVAKYTNFLILLFSAWLMMNLHARKFASHNTILADGKGYYAYLPAVFIYHDLNFSFFDSIENRYYEGGTKYDYRSGANGKPIDKYFSGVAVLQTPFFLAGMITTSFTDEVHDGYSYYYMLWFMIGALFYLWLGLKHLRLFLRMHGAGEGMASFITAVIFFGTNLMYYSIIEPSMSHLYSFTMITIFLVYAKRWLANEDLRSFLIITFLLGMIISIRPVNGLIVLWIFVEERSFASIVRKKLNTLRNARNYIIAFLLFCIPISIQLIIYRVQCGSFFVNSYGNERFHFGEPHMFDFLFSYRKGLFVYLPITFIALFGLIPLWKTNRYRAVSIVIFLTVVIYILSSWWMWYYGGSFGPRVFVEYLPVFALLLYHLLNSVRAKSFKLIITGILIILSLFCQFQTAQYRYGMIHWSDMNGERYWKVFLDPDFRRLY